MILTICPNPSIDCTVEVDSLNVGMLNRIRNKEETYSGKALNVAMGIARLNEAEVVTTGFMFNEHNKLFEQKLEKENVRHDFVYNDGCARLNYKIIDNKSMLTEINDIGCEVSRDKQLELIEKVKKLSVGCSVAVMSGSLPKGVAPEFYYEVLSVIPDNVKVIVDTEKENMLCALKRKVFMVKPNLRELESFSGKEIASNKDVISACKKYFDMGVQYAMVSLGADGAVLTDGKESFYCKSATVAVNSTVGAGDCMLSACCVKLEQNMPLEEVLRCSVAAGTASITTSGTNLFYKDKYQEIYQKIFVEKI